MEPKEEVIEDLELTPTEELPPRRHSSFDLFAGDGFDDDFDDWGWSGRSVYSRPVTTYKGPSKWDRSQTSYQRLGFDLDLATKEMVQPMMGRWEKRDLKSMLSNDLPLVYDDPETGKIMQREDIPDYLKYDIYSLFHNRMREISFKDITDKNRWQYNVLNKVNHHYLRTITEGNALYSYVVTRNMVSMLMKLTSQEQQQKCQQQQQKGQGEKQQEQSLEKMFGGNGDKQQNVEQALQEAMDQIEKDLSEVKKAMDFGKEAGKNLDLKQVKEMMDLQVLMKDVQVSSSVIMNFIKNTLKFSKAYFSRQYTEQEEDLIEAEEVEELLNLENLMPQLRRIGLSELVVPERTYHMAFDLYIDISGSMGNAVYFSREQEEKKYGGIEALTLCKLLALKIMDLGFVKDVYFFEDYISKASGRASIITQETCGGTDIDKVVRQIKANSRPSLILTDMQANICQYTPNAYFIGVNNPSFHLRSTDARKFRSNRQLMEFKHGVFTFV